MSTEQSLYPTPAITHLRVLCGVVVGLPALSLFFFSLFLCMFCYCICIAIMQPAIVSDTRKKDQSEVDAVIMKALAKVSHKV
jgi:hypothetical protein